MYGSNHCVGGGGMLLAKIGGPATQLVTELGQSTVW